MSSTRSQRQDEVRIAVTILECLSLGASLFILAASAWIRSVPSAKQHVQRVSYNIILWVLLGQSCYSIIRLVMYTGDAAREFFVHTPGLCVSGVYFFIYAVHLTNFLITCIALNLMLIVCFGVNPIERSTTKKISLTSELLRWYVGGSIAVAAFIPIVPAALGLFGQDPLYRICYFTPYELEERMKVVVLSLVLWEVLSCVTATAAIVAVLITLFKQGRSTARALLLGNPNNIDRHGELIHHAKHSSKRSPLSSLTSCVGRHFDTDEERDLTPDTETHHLQDRFLGIALKISLYPIFLIFVNLVTAVADLYFNSELRNGISNESEWAFLVVYQVLYAGRGLLFACLCICIDPSFRAGFSAAWHANRNASRAIRGQPDLNAGDKMSFGQFLSSQNDLPSSPPMSSPRQVSDNEVELAAALTTLSYVSTYTVPPLAEPSADKDASPRRLTRKFAGVASESLPTGLSDDVDVDLRMSYAASAARREQAAEKLWEASELKEASEEEKEDSGGAQLRQTSTHESRAPTHESHAPTAGRPSVESRRRRFGEDWFTGEDARRRFEELNAQL